MNVEQLLDPLTIDTRRYDFDAVRYQLTGDHVALPYVELSVGSAPAGTLARFTLAHLALLWQLHAAASPGDADITDEIRVERADGEALVVRVGIGEARFAVVLLGESRHLCAAAGCEGDAIGGSRYLGVCRDHLDAESEGVRVFNGPTEVDRRDRFRLRARAWRALIDGRRSELIADTKRLTAAERRAPSGY